MAVLVDLQGPKIRLGKFEDGPYDLAVGDVFKITTEDIIGTKQICSTTFKGLPDDVKPGDFLLIDDGKVTLRVTDTDGTVVTTVVDVAGRRLEQQGDQPARASPSTCRRCPRRTRPTCAGA